MPAAWSERFRQRLEERHPADAQHVTAVVDAILAVAAWLAWIASDSLGWERSLQYRWQLALTQSAPVFTVAACFLVMLICVAFIMPLVKLLNELS